MVSHSPSLFFFWPSSLMWVSSPFNSLDWILTWWGWLPRSSEGLVDATFDLLVDHGMVSTKVEIISLLGHSGPCSLNSNNPFLTIYTVLLWQWVYYYCRCISNHINSSMCWAGSKPPVMPLMKQVLYSQTTTAGSFNVL